MKKITLLLVIQLFMLKLNAQVVFCPRGAEWNYNYSSFWTQQAAEQVKIVYSGDTIVGNDTLKILNHSRFFTRCSTRACAPTYIKQKGDTVFMKNNCTNGIWQILYNFASQSGQSWHNTLQVLFNPTVTANYTVSVLSTNTVQANGFILKELTAQYTYSYLNFSITELPIRITERLGGSNYLFNFYNRTVTDCDYFLRNLCYKDSVFGTKQFSEFPCNYSNPLDIEINFTNSNYFNIYPNPGKDVIRFKHKNSIKSLNIKIVDLLGKEVMTLILNAGEELNIANLPNGFYNFYLFNPENSSIQRAKFVKD